MNRAFKILTLALITLPLWLSSCATLQKSVVDLSSVKFSLDHVSEVRVAGINLMNIESLDELNMFQVARATLGASRERLPLDLTIHLKTENPAINQVSATLTKMDWTLILDGRETISGILTKSVKLPAGSAQNIPLKLSLNMYEFFNEKNMMDLLELGLAFVGEDGRIPQGVALKLRPTIDTPFGPITYGKPILIESHRPEQRSF